jgi:hypothetical protein
MISHDELDQLSAYLDGELDPDERTRIDAHLPSCAECRTSLDALRATIVDLKALPEPAPSEQDSWALRSAIARANAPSRRWQRFAIAAGSAAAALIAIVTLAHNGSLSPSHGKDSAAGSPGPALVSVAQNFDKFSAQEYLLVTAGKLTPAPAGAPLSSGRSQQETKTVAGGATPEASVLTPHAVYGGEAAQAYDAGTTTELDRCVGIVRGATQEYLKPIAYELASFDGTPAFFLVFQASDRYELWVMSHDPKHPCDLLFFSQAK